MSFADLFNLAPALPADCMVHQSWRVGSDARREALQLSPVPLLLLSPFQDALYCRRLFLEQRLPLTQAQSYWLNRWVHGPHSDGQYDFNIGRIGFTAKDLVLDLQSDLPLVMASWTVSE